MLRLSRIKGYCCVYHRTERSFYDIKNKDICSAIGNITQSKVSKNSVRWVLGIERVLGIDI